MALLGLTATPAFAADQLIPGKLAIVKPGKLVKFLSKPPTGSLFALPSGANDPTTSGATLRFFDTIAGGGDVTYILPAGAAWKPLGTPPGAKGFKYKGTGTAGDPCKRVIIQATAIKAICKGVDVTLPLPVNGDFGVIFTVGTGMTYCAELGGTPVKNDSTVFKRKNAPPPPVCSTVLPPPPPICTSTLDCAYMEYECGIFFDECGNLHDCGLCSDLQSTINPILPSESWILWGDRPGCRLPGQSDLPTTSYYSIVPYPDVSPVAGSPDITNEASPPVEPNVALLGDITSFTDFATRVPADELRRRVYFTEDDEGNILCLFALTPTCDQVGSGPRVFSLVVGDGPAPSCQ